MSLSTDILNMHKEVSKLEAENNRIKGLLQQYCPHEDVTNRDIFTGHRGDDWVGTLTTCNICGHVQRKTLGE